MLDGADDVSALRAAEALRAAVEADGRLVDGTLVGLTVSIGVATLETGDDVTRLFKRADAALYRAKHAGRNCVIVARPDIDHPRLEPV